MSKLKEFPFPFDTLATILSSNVVLYMCMARALCEYVMSHHGQLYLVDLFPQSILWWILVLTGAGGGATGGYWWLSGEAVEQVLKALCNLICQASIRQIAHLATGLWKCHIFVILFWTMTSWFMYNLEDLFKDMQGKDTHTTEPLKKGSQTMVAILAVDLLDFNLFVITTAFIMITSLRVYRPAIISWVTNTWGPSDLEWETFCNGYNWAMFMQVGLVVQMIWRDPWVVLLVTVIAGTAYTWAGVKIPCWRQITNCVLVIIIIHSTLHMEIKPPQPDSSFEVEMGPCEFEQGQSKQLTAKTVTFHMIHAQYDEFTSNGMCKTCDPGHVTLAYTVSEQGKEVTFCKNVGDLYFLKQKTLPKRVKIFWVSSSVESEDTMHKVIACVFLLIFLWNEENVWYYSDSLLHTTSQQGAPAVTHTPLPPPALGQPQQPAPPPVIERINTAHQVYASSTEQAKKDAFENCDTITKLEKFHDKHLGTRCGLAKKQHGETKDTFPRMKARYKAALKNAFTMVHID